MKGEQLWKTKDGKVHAGGSFRYILTQHTGSTAQAFYAIGRVIRSTRRIDAGSKVPTSSLQSGDKTRLFPARMQQNF